MEKNLEIKVKIVNTEFIVEANPNLDDWNNSDIDSKKYYVNERVKEYIIDNINEVVNELLDNSEISY